MGARMLQIKKKEEPKEEIIEEKEKEPIFENDEKPNIETIIEPVEQEEEIQEVVEQVKPKRTRKMTPAAKEQLDKARLKSIETRKRNSAKKKEKEEQEYREKFSKEYQDEISLLKQQLEEMKNKTQESKVVEKVVYKEKETPKPTIDDKISQYRFNLEDLDYYAKSYHEKMTEEKNKLKKNKKQDVMNRYYYNLR